MWVNESSRGFADGLRCGKDSTPSREDVGPSGTFYNSRLTETDHLPFGPSQVSVRLGVPLFKLVRVSPWIDHLCLPP